MRTAVLVPYGIVTVVAAYSWQYAWTPGTGYLAELLPAGEAPLTEQWPALGIIILAEVWKTTPFMALLLLAGLALVPEETLRAAMVDRGGAVAAVHEGRPAADEAGDPGGAAVPHLDAFRVFDSIYVLTRGAHGTGSLSILGYDNLFTALNLGIGSAISVLIFLCVALIAFAFVKLFGAAAPGAGEVGR